MKISKGTIIRTIMYAVVLLNMILKQKGYKVLPISEGSVANTVEIILSIAIFVTGFWKNNSYSKKARKADEFLKQLKESEDE